MSKTNWQDPGSSEIISPHISGLQEAVGRIEEALGFGTTAETNIALSEVYISSTDRYRIYQAPEGKRNWVANPVPEIKVNGNTVSAGFVVDYGGGAVIFNPSLTAVDVVTANFTRINGPSVAIETVQGAQDKADASEAAANAYTDQEVTDLAGTGRTTETVKGNADALTAHLADLAAHALTADKTIYVATTGNDTTGDGSSGAPYATLQKAIDMISRLPSGHIATISVAGGNYAGFTMQNYTGRINVTLTGNVTITSKITHYYGGALVFNGPYALTLQPSGNTEILDVRFNASCAINTNTLVINGVNTSYPTQLFWVGYNSTVIVAVPSGGCTVSNVAGSLFAATMAGTILTVGVVSGNITGVWYDANGGLIYVNVHSGTGGTKVIKNGGGMVKTGAGVDLS